MMICNRNSRVVEEPTRSWKASTTKISSGWTSTYWLIQISKLIMIMVLISIPIMLIRMMKMMIIIRWSRRLALYGRRRASRRSARRLSAKSLVSKSSTRMLPIQPWAINLCKILKAVQNQNHAKGTAQVPLSATGNPQPIGIEVAR